MFERFDVARKTEAAAKSMKQVQDTIRLLKSSGMTRNNKMPQRNSGANDYEMVTTRYD